MGFGGPAKPHGAAMAFAVIAAAAQAHQDRERDDMTYHRDEWGRTLGTCNSCGEEGLLDDECDTQDCDDGEMVPHDDESSED